MKNKKKTMFILVTILVVILLGIGIAFFIKNTLNNDLESEDKTSEKREDNKEKESPPEKESTGKPLLYKVTKDGNDNELYLFGSIHVADDRAYPMDDVIMDAYKKSEALVVEFDLVAYSKNINVQMEDVKLMLCDPGKTIKDYIQPEVYDKLIKYMKDNKIYSKAYEMYKPAFFYSLLTNVTVDKSGLDANKGIDMYFLTQAHKDKKEIIELETSTFQTQTLLGLSDDLYSFMINEIVTDDSIEVKNLKKMYEAWLEGNIEELLAIEEESEEVPEDLLDDFAEYNKLLESSRNVGMLDKVKQRFENGENIFVVVGAAHIVGDEGLAKSFKDAGYKVEKVDY